MGWGEPQGQQVAPLTRASSDNDPDTTLEGRPFVTAEELAESGEVVETADVFALVAAYDHAVGSPTAPEFETYDEARDAGIVLLTVNANVVSFRIDKRTTRKA